MDNAMLIERLYQGLRNLDGDAMAACYAPDARFEDPAFGVLIGEQVGGMWRMLTSRSDGIEVELSNVEADETSGSAHWVARYTFGPDKRPVVNRINARFAFANGLIADHVDTFSLYAWSRQALGPIGFFLGATPFVKNRVNSQARRGLEVFMAADGDRP
ncbi:MAG: nuclear transport factor 2 family protein [Acidimicrobiia bacterium]|nr:nuclear transport factor 2 family protein [Acidimicrobiia bacterium]NNL68738.1 nuclear transport factor 2 family protein [Acidimicrobiia bacterium]